ncbi:ABC transporter ATP-binding protein [Pseudorhodoplanes sp.]|uniref:ABC transporter ATP-binding protein n=1 Tax=Pseudorhodoplanes sp. TaxID=1934341 RepID=UPI003D13AC98
MRNLLSIAAVTSGYVNTTVLEQVSLDIGLNETWALLGRNGVGKTTLLATIMGLTTMRGGAIKFREHDITTMPTHQRARLGLGYVPQEREIFPSLTVDENLLVATRPGEWTRERIFELFPRLADRRRNYGNQLSGGEQQMLAVGRALAGNPMILLLDEPFEGLAPVMIDSLMGGLIELRRQTKMAMLLVEQQVDIALELSEFALVLDKGLVVWRGESQSLNSSDKIAELISLEEPASLENRALEKERRSIDYDNRERRRRAPTDAFFAPIRNRDEGKLSRPRGLDSFSRKERRTG